MPDAHIQKGTDCIVLVRTRCPLHLLQQGDLYIFFILAQTAIAMCLQALETRKALNGAAANSPQSTAVQLYAVINAQSGVVKSQVRFRVDTATYDSPLIAGLQQLRSYSLLTLQHQ